jgi:hypothetical protein
MVTLLTTSSGLAWGYIVITLVTGNWISGSSSILRVSVAQNEIPVTIAMIKKVIHRFFKAILVSQLKYCSSLI